MIEDQRYLQALDVIPMLRETMKIERAKMRVRISLPAKEAKQIKDKLETLFQEIEVEDWSEGALELVVPLSFPCTIAILIESIADWSYRAGRLSTGGRIGAQGHEESRPSRVTQSEGCQGRRRRHRLIDCRFAPLYCLSTG